MEVHISKNVEKVLSEASKKSGFNEEEFVERAVLFYVDSIQKQLGLKKEFVQWDELSDEALVNFEALL
ncbi:MAG: hypothetical protein ACUZ8N_13935 [Candidatus Scalindua sp.]